MSRTFCLYPLWYPFVSTTRMRPCGEGGRELQPPKPRSRPRGGVYVASPGRCMAVSANSSPRLPCDHPHRCQTPPPPPPEARGTGTRTQCQHQQHPSPRHQSARGLLQTAWTCRGGSGHCVCVRGRPHSVRYRLRVCRAGRHGGGRQRRRHHRLHACVERGTGTVSASAAVRASSANNCVSVMGG